MADLGNALNDILGPASPAHGASMAGAYVAWALAAAALVGLAFWGGPRLRVWRTRLALWRLRRAHRHARVDTRQAAYRLAAELRRYFAVQRLDADAIPPGAGPGWAVVLRRLDRLRYRRGPERAGQWQRVYDCSQARLKRLRLKRRPVKQRAGRAA